MAYGTRYRCEFSTVNGRALAIEIQQDGWTGGVTMVEGGATPIVTQEDSADEVYAPVRGQTGTLNLIQEGGALDGLVPQNVHEFAVLLQDEATQDYLWRGFIKPEALSQDWAPEPYEISYSLVSPLEALEAFPLDYSKGFGMASLGDTLVEVIGRLGVELGGIFFPDEFWVGSRVGGADGLSMLLRDTSCSRWNWFRTVDNDDDEATQAEQYNATTCREWLEEFCKFFGWTAYERGEDLWFVSRASTTYVLVDATNFAAAMASGFTTLTGTPYTATDEAVPDLPLDGDQHKASLLQGFKKVSVKSDVNAVGDVVPKLDISNHVPLGATTWTFGSFLRTVDYRPATRYATGDVMRMYNGADLTEITKSTAQEHTALLTEGIGAMPVRFDRYTQADLDGDENTPPKFNYDFSDGIMAKYEYFFPPLAAYYRAPQGAAGRNYKIIDFSSPATASYDNGAFCISFGTLAAQYIIENGYKWDYGGGTGWYEAQFHVGGKYWNGAAWQSGACWFSLCVITEGSSGDAWTGKVKNTKTLSMPYNGLEGYVIPVSGHLVGEVGFALSFNHNRNADNLNTTTYTDRYDLVIFKDFQVEWQAPDNAEYTEFDGDSHTYTRGTGANFEEEADTVELRMASDNGDPASYSKLYYRDAPLVDWFDNVQGRSRRPELSLLDRLQDAYGHTADKLELELDQATEEVYGMPRRPAERYEDGGRNYVHLCAEQDWKMAHEKLTIIQI